MLKFIRLLESKDFEELLLLAVIAGTHTGLHRLEEGSFFLGVVDSWNSYVDHCPSSGFACVS